MLLHFAVLFAVVASSEASSNPIHDPGNAARESYRAFLRQLDEQIAKHPGSDELRKRRDRAVAELARLNCEPCAAASTAVPEPNTPPDKSSTPRAMEIWLEPLAAIPFAPQGQAHFALGATFPIAPNWELSTSLATTIGWTSSVDTMTPAWQIWVSASPVRHFYRPASRSGFFVGPKLIISLMHAGTLWWEGVAKNADGTYDYPTIGQPPTTSLDIELGVEIGYRFQFKWFALTLVLPTPSVGYAWNYSGMSFTTVIGYLAGKPTPHDNTFVFGLDVNLVRLGVSF